MPVRDEKPRILIADDHPTSRTVLAVALDRAGYVTREVTTGPAVAQSIYVYEPDVVILDHHLPGDTGAPVALELRRDLRTAQLPMVIATGDLTATVDAHRIDPFTRYLPKPLDLTKLTAALGTLLQSKPNQQQPAAVLDFWTSSRNRRRGPSVGSFEDCLLAARNGDNTAFDYMYRSLGPRIQQYARVRGAPQPEDLVNDVLLKIFTRLHQFDGNEPQFNAWVFQTVRNTIIDQARRRAVRPVETLVDLTPDTESPDDPERVAVGNLELGALLVHLDVLTDDQREVVLLRVLADLSINSIAEILDKTPGATKAIQRRAFATLAKTLQNE